MQNYLPASVNLDGFSSDVIKKAVAPDIPVELNYAQLPAHRVKTLGGVIPGSAELSRDQSFLQPTRNSIDVVSIIKGVIQVEEGAISQYNIIIKLCEGIDDVTQDLAIEILGDEENHRREFKGYMPEYEK